MDKRLECTRKSHQSSLAVWVALVKVAGRLWWVLGVVIVVVHVASEISTYRAVRYGVDFAMLFTTGLFILLFAFGAGSLLCALGHGLATLGRIEENTCRRPETGSNGAGASSPNEE